VQVAIYRLGYLYGCDILHPPSESTLEVWGPPNITLDKMILSDARVVDFPLGATNPG